ncbi:hypothetical protein AMTR_s00001p00273080 [Amborella trichopoda]|uniref:Uncharacterized protein n=1 Tax=Amborella trichopoda TaxID=13333 RepID=W1NN45_AMBTC|nr:hypothetical protein AMTR_s00001p00273080 [Amborella trichopoda]
MMPWIQKLLNLVERKLSKTLRVLLSDAPKELDSGGCLAVNLVSLLRNEEHFMPKDHGMKEGIMGDLYGKNFFIGNMGELLKTPLPANEDLESMVIREGLAELPLCDSVPPLLDNFDMDKEFPLLGDLFNHDAIISLLKTVSSSSCSPKEAYTNSCFHL